MRNMISEQAILDFYMYPLIGGDDWRYTFQTARVRAIEMQLLSKTTLLDLANAETFEAAVDLLSATEYALPPGTKNLTEMEKILLLRRSALRELFEVLCINKSIVKLLKTRDDFANLRLAVRRTLTGRPVGADYSSDGNVTPEMLQDAFEKDNLNLLPLYLQKAAENAVLAYYQNKDVRRIDYEVDAAQAQYNLKEARRLENIFLLGLFRIQTDLTNIRTMLRLKFTPSLTGAGFSQSEQRNVLLDGGFIDLERLTKALDLGYETIGQSFFVTPYYQIAEAGAAYLLSDKSFLKLEQQCDEFLTGFLKNTIQITAGPQPIIAYLLMKEMEIRKVRLILTAKKNSLDTKLILDRIS